MERGDKDCEVVVSRKLRGQSAKSMKFVDGLMIHSGDPVNYYVHSCVPCAFQTGYAGHQSEGHAALGPKCKTGPKKSLPDLVSIVEPKDEILPTIPISEQKGREPDPPAIAPVSPYSIAGSPASVPGVWMRLR
jgi:small subunit ribosomal protein S3e